MACKLFFGSVHGYHSENFFFNAALGEGIHLVKSDYRIHSVIYSVNGTWRFLVSTVLRSLFEIPRGERAATTDKKIVLWSISSTYKLIPDSQHEWLILIYIKREYFY